MAQTYLRSFSIDKPPNPALQRTCRKRPAAKLYVRRHGTVVHKQEDHHAASVWSAVRFIVVGVRDVYRRQWNCWNRSSGSCDCGLARRIR